MQQFVICKNDFPIYSLPLGTSEETANKVLAEIKLVEGTETSKGQNIYWYLQTTQQLSQNKNTFLQDVFLSVCSQLSWAVDFQAVSKYPTEFLLNRIIDGFTQMQKKLEEQEDK